MSSFALQMAMAPRATMEVSPAQIAFSQMLALPWAAMETLIERELSANDALERLDGGECPICQGAWRARCPVCSVPARREPCLGDVEDLAATEPDTEALRHAVRLETAASEAPIADCLIDSLDEHGLLDRAPGEIAGELGVPEVDVMRVLQVVQRVGPPGVGASGVPECLLLQLDALPVKGDDRLARAVIAEHLPALARGRFAAIAKALGVPRARVQEVLELIRIRLRPYPAFDGRAPAVASYVIPDVLIREHEGDLIVELVEPAMTKLCVRRGAPEASRARAFLSQLHDRWNTLRRVAEYTIERQRDFVSRGATAMRPLTRAEVAAALDLHESTVSRAIAGKYALLPDDTIVALSTFFGVSGGVDGELRRLLESAHGPLSDQRLTELLCEAGYPIARRTVAKHRARIGFEAASLR